MDLLLQWALVALFLLFLTYCAFAIKDEKGRYLESFKWIQWNGLSLAIPNWWSEKYESNDKVQFKRTDTYYDWNCYFQSHKKTDLDQCLQWLLERDKIDLDLNYVKTTDIDHIIRNTQELERIEAIVRVESTATVDNLDRTYIDLCLIKVK